MATTSPPLSFPKSSIAFSKAKQDVWLKLIQHMDVLYELVRKKGIDYLDKKTIRCQFLCRLSFLIKERRVADRAKPELIMIKLTPRAQTSQKTKANNDETAASSEPAPKFK